MAEISHVHTSILDIGYEHSGPANAPAVVLLHGYPFDLLHGYPFDARAFDGVIPIVNAAGFRTIVPYLRGYGPTRFLSSDTIRSGEQAALGMDLLELLDALRVERAILAGFDWGGRAACVVSALWPQRSRGLVTCTGYQIQDIANSDKPADPEQERRFWYQFYFNTERGRKRLTQMRYELGQYIWQLWSPNWTFDEETYRQTAKSFDNPEFVDVVAHSYMHRIHNAPGDPRYARSRRSWQPCPK